MYISPLEMSSPEEKTYNSPLELRILRLWNYDEETTLPVIFAPLSPDYVLDSPDYSPDFDSNFELAGNDSSDEDVTEATKSLHTQTALTLVVQPPLTRPHLQALLLSPSPPPLVVSPPPPERVESIEDDVETLCARLTSAEQETVTLHARVETLEQHNKVTDLQDSQVTNRLEITELRSRVEYAETRLERSHAIEQQAETLQASLRASQIDITHFLESRMADRLEITELQSRA
ncbi:hypothetical protein Tco_1546293 [Tanacetum coccineum]